MSDSQGVRLGCDLIAAYTTGYEQGRSDRDADSPYAIEIGDEVSVDYEDAYGEGYDDGYMSCSPKHIRESA